MTGILSAPIPHLLLFCLAASIVIMGIIAFIGRDGSGFFLANSAPCIAFIWFSSFVLGTPDFPPRLDSSGILSAITALLMIGTTLDFYLVRGKLLIGTISFLIIFICGMAITIWMQGKIDIWSLPITIGWCIMMITVQRIGCKENSGSAEGTLLLVMGALGVSVTAWISNITIERDLSLALCTLLSIFFLCNLTKTRFYFGYSILLASGGSIYMLVIRLSQQDPFLIPAFIILSFIFFSDNANRHMQIRFKYLSYIPNSIKILILSSFPLALAAVTTIVANTFSSN